MKTDVSSSGAQWWSLSGGRGPLSPAHTLRAAATWKQVSPGMEARVSLHPWDTHGGGGQPPAGSWAPTPPCDWLHKLSVRAPAGPLELVPPAAQLVPGPAGGQHPHLQARLPSGETGRSLRESSCRGCWETGTGKRWPRARDPHHHHPDPRPRPPNPPGSHTGRSEGRRPPHTTP